ncbi:MAG TPA: DUF4843 domain-containing protein [Puia sp.]|nr:DUF4843 domain-containing protein [Puia sp.]
MPTKRMLYALGAILLTACSKDERLVYHDPAAVYFFTDSLIYQTDSLTYSFAIHDSQLQQDTVKIPLKIIGTATGADRKVSVEAVADSTTAMEGKNYKLLPAVIRAGRYKDSLAVLVMKTPALDSTEVRLLLRISASSDLQPGVKERDTYLVKINNILTKPDNWDGLLTLFFGTYSKVKYRFIIDVTGISVFNFKTATGGADFQYYQYLKQVVRDALTNYEAQHGPLTDESGNQVTFPS